MIFKQYEHQKKEWRNRNRRARAYLWSMRTGKTKQVIDNACHLFLAAEIDCVLVVAPNNVHAQWTEIELPKHRWENVIAPAMAWRLKDKNNERRLEAQLGINSTLYMSWLAVNMESLIIEKTKKAIARFIRGKNFMLVVDESHHFASPGAKRTRYLRGLARQAAYRRILTGTPVEESPLQAFSQFELLEKSALDFETYEDFKRRYVVFEDRWAGSRRYEAVSDYVNMPELRAKMAKYSSVVERDDCEDLPPLQHDLRTYDLTKEQLSWWKKCKEEELEFFEKREMYDGVAGGAKLIKLQQIEGGFWLKDGKAEEIIPLSRNPQMLILSDEIEQYDGSVIVWFQFVHEIEAAAKLIPGAGRYHGRARNREHDLLQFKRGKLRVLLAQPQAGGEGRDLSAAGKVLWYSQTPRATLRAQASERATIAGGKSVQLVDVISPGGVNEYFWELTKRKTALADDIGRRGLKEILSRLEVN